MWHPSTRRAVRTEERGHERNPSNAPFVPYAGHLILIMYPGNFEHWDTNRQGIARAIVGTTPSKTVMRLSTHESNTQHWQAVTQGMPIYHAAVVLTEALREVVGVDGVQLVKRPHLGYLTDKNLDVKTLARAAASGLGEEPTGRTHVAIMSTLGVEGDKFGFMGTDSIAAYTFKNGDEAGPPQWEEIYPHPIAGADNATIPTY